MEQERSSGRIAQGRQDLADWESARPRSFFEADLNLQRVLQMYLGPELATCAPLLHRTGRLVATRMDELARLCNRDENLPLLRPWSSIGERVEEVVFTAAHHELGALFWATETLGQGIRLPSVGGASALGGRSYPIGTAIIRNAGNPADLHTRLSALATKHRAEIVPIDTTYVDSGISLGSNYARFLKAPRAQSFR